MRISAVTALLFVGVACLPEAGLLSDAELAGACQVGAETSWDAHIGPLADGWEPTSPIWPGATGRFLVYEGRATADGQDTTGGRFAVCEDLDGCTTDGWHLALGDGWLELGRPEDTYYLSAHVIAQGDDRWVGRCGPVGATTTGTFEMERVR